ncbi:MULTISPECIES: hypothetical protein [Pseudomonas]|uniref:hypothetical protein n=1 Tax=Pseudomonas TaxID=286 RepID=UPI001E4F6968|nr:MULTISPECIES: hypothetical protein [Pseudomonas]MCE1118240.1 hypothetical protein [Pseudomonas sp. NMI795_08]
MVGVRGLALFGQHFCSYRDQYVLIGGVASSLTMDEAGIAFRSTKDLDIVLVIEALDSQFVAAFWAFVHSGGYQIRQVGKTHPVFYRFQNPTDGSYPAQLELFSRAPDGFELPEHATLTPIPTDESVSSLSAILLDEDYYAFLLEGRQHLMLIGLLTGDRVELPESIASDMAKFLTRLAEEDRDTRAMGSGASQGEIIERLRLAFGIEALESLQPEKERRDD